MGKGLNKERVARILTSYHLGFMTCGHVLSTLLCNINIDDIESDIKLLPPDLAKALRDHVLSEEWPWTEGRGYFIVASAGPTSIPAERFEIF